MLWTRINAGGTLPAPRNNFGADALDGSLYIFGGKGPATSSTSLKGAPPWPCAGVPHVLRRAYFPSRYAIKQIRPAVPLPPI